MPLTPRVTPNCLTVEILAFPDVQLLDVTGPLQVFASAISGAAELGKPVPYRVQVVAQRSPVITNSGLGVLTQPLPKISGSIDTLIVAGGRGVHVACQDESLLRWVKNRAARARRVVSVCSGAFLLAAAGLLEGRRVVTHWRDCSELARRSPTATVEVDPIFIRDGSIWSSAGVTAGIDLALALVQEDLGHVAAMGVARDLVVFLRRPGGQAQFSQALALQERSDSFSSLHAWMTEHIAGDLSVASLATQCAMSERTFIRRYRSAHGVSPGRAVEHLRVEAAQRLLVSSTVPIKRIAQRCGFGSEEHMRQTFQRHLAISPRDFRARFSEKGAARH
jgi:transcriptional regulator GlxA family with amidase domain